MYIHLSLRTSSKLTACCFWHAVTCVWVWYMGGSCGHTLSLWHAAALLASSTCYADNDMCTGFLDCVTYRGMSSTVCLLYTSCTACAVLTTC
jgi:hypothetical protein